MLATLPKLSAMNLLRKLVLASSILFLHSYLSAQQSCVEPNPIAHILLIPAGLPKLDGAALPQGSIISVVYQSGDSLRCAGQVTWQNKSVILQAYGKSSDGDEGYLADEPIKFRIILPNGCTIEDDLIVTKFQDIENNQNPGFQNLALNRLEQFDATTPKFNVQLISKDTIYCNENQIEITPTVDVLGAKFEWSADSLGIISRKSNLSASAAGIYQLVVSLNGCRKTQEIEIIDLRNTLTLDLMPNEPAICPGESITLEAFTNQKSAGFVWSIGTKGNAIEVTKAAFYSVTVSNELGCFVEKSIEVRLKSKPELDLGPDLEICQGDSISLSAPFSSDYHYRWTTGDTSFQVLAKKAGTFLLSLTNAENCSNSDSVKIGVSLPPSLSLPSLVQLCDGKSTQLRAISDAVLFRWNTGDTTATIQVSKAGSYQVDVLNKIGCRTSASVEVVSVPVPTSSLEAEINRCESDTVVLDPKIENAKYTWSTGDTTRVIQPKKSGTYFVNITLGQGCALSDTVLLNFLAKPEIELGPNLNLCDGQFTSLEVKDSLAYRYRWNTNEKDAKIQVEKSGLYIVTVSNIANCRSTDSVRVEFMATPPPILPDSIISCKGKLSKLVAGDETYQYSWNTGESALLIIPENTGWYSVSITDGTTKCNAIDSAFVFIAPSPDFKLADTFFLCQSKKLEIKTLDGTGLKYQWNTGATTSKIEANSVGVYSVEVSNEYGCFQVDSTILVNPPKRNTKWPNPILKCAKDIAVLSGGSLGQIISWNTGATQNEIEVNTSGTFTVSFIDQYGCTAKDSVKVVFNKTPSLPLPDSLRICQGQSQTLDVRNTGVSYSWNTGATTDVLNVQRAQLYKVIVTNEFGCKASDSTQLILWNNPVVTLPKADTICPNENIVIDARSFGQKFRWSNGATTGIITTSSPGNFQVTVTDRNGCAGQGSTQVIAQSLPTASIESPRSYLCFGDSVILSGKGGAPFKWLDPSNTSRRLSTDRILAKPKTKSTYGFIAENFCGTDTAFVQIEVRRVNGSAGEDTTILAGRKLKLQASGGKTYQWTSPEFPLSTPQSANPEVSPEDSTYFVVFIEDEFKCRLTDTVFIGVYSDITELIKPINLFTPNGDGKNDVLKFKDLNLFNTNKIKVFNRWGAVVFQQSNYQNDWDGTYNGRPLPAGVYYYVLELDEAVLKSSLTLIRN